MKRIAVAFLIVVFAGACGSTASPGASSTSGGHPVASASARPSLAATASVSATLSPVPSASSTPATSSADEVRDNEEWVAFQSLADQFDPTADRDGIDHDDTIFLVRPDGTGLHRLAPPDLVGSEIRPTWSPDGQHIAFVRGHLTPDEPELWVIDANGTNAHLAFACHNPCGNIDYPDWGPDGHTIYFQRNSVEPPGGGLPTFDIWRLDVATGLDELILTRDDGMTIEQIRISPDGQDVVFVRYRDLVADLGSALFVASLEGGPERQLTEDWDLHAAYPDWSVDGRIAFNSYDLRSFPDTAEAANLYAVADDGTQLKPLTQFGQNDERAAQPRWTADGTGIVYTLVSQNPSDSFGDRTLGYMNADGSGQRSLTPEPMIGTHPELRPIRP